MSLVETVQTLSGPQRSIQQRPLLRTHSGQASFARLDATPRLDQEMPL